MTKRIIKLPIATVEAVTEHQEEGAAPEVQPSHDVVADVGGHGEAVAGTETEGQMKSRANLKKKGTKPYPTIDEVVLQIKTLLQSKKTYSTSLDHAIYVAAVNYLAMMHVQRDIARASKTYYQYIDKMGNTQYKIKPEYAKLPDLTTSAVKSLKSLGLTLETMEASDDDPLEALTNQVNDMLNG